MSEVAILVSVLGGLWAIAIGLIGVVWGMLREQNRSQGDRIAKLEAQNTEQETAIGRLTERTIARETAHAEHREGMQSQVTRLETRIESRFNSLEGKIDRLLGSKTPFPSHYGPKPPGG